MLVSKKYLTNSLNHLKDMTTEQMLELAINQITWFVHRDQWHNITSLAEEMWLTKIEWEKIKKSCEWIPKETKNDLDIYFK